MCKPLIKIFGERHTGTKYLNLLLVINLKAEIIPGIENLSKWYFWKAAEGSWRYEMACELFFKHNFSKTLGWKHILLPPLDVYRKTSLCSRDILFLTLTKNPYSWLLSLYNSPKHARQTYASFEEFLVTPWKTIPRENGPKEFATPMEMWNQKNSAYLRLKSGPWTVINLRYEDLVGQPEAYINRIAEAKNIERKLDTFQNREIPTTKNGVGKSYAFYRDYYLNERWRAKLTDRQVEMINPRLDDTLMAQFGYSKLDAAALSKPGQPIA